MPLRFSFERRTACAAMSMSGVPFELLVVKSRAANSVGVAQSVRRWPLRRPMTRSCSMSVVQSQFSMRIRMRRVTR